MHLSQRIHGYVERVHCPVGHAAHGGICRTVGQCCQRQAAHHRIDSGAQLLPGHVQPRRAVEVAANLKRPLDPPARWCVTALTSLHSPQHGHHQVTVQSVIVAMTSSYARIDMPHAHIDIVHRPEGGQRRCWHPGSADPRPATGARQPTRTPLRSGLASAVEPGCRPTPTPGNERSGNQVKDHGLSPDDTRPHRGRG